MKGGNAIKSTVEIGHVLFLQSNSSRQQLLKQSVSCLCGAADWDSLEKRYDICQQVLHTGWQECIMNVITHRKLIYVPCKCFNCVFIFLRSVWFMIKFSNISSFKKKALTLVATRSQKEEKAERENEKSVRKNKHSDGNSLSQQIASCDSAISGIRWNSVRFLSYRWAF